VKDRVAQAVVKAVIETLFEARSGIVWIPAQTEFHQTIDIRNE
jgi:hypothetical protein